MKKGWEYKKLGEVCDKVSNIRWQNVPSDVFYSYVDLTAVDRASFSITDTQSINCENAPSRAKQIIKQNDILFGTTRPTLKRVCIVEDKNDGDICSTGFCVLRPKSEIVSPKWILYQLMAEKYYSYIEPLQSGATYPAVTDGVVKSYIIPIPPISEQQHIVEELDLLSSIIEKKKAQLNELDNLAQSLFYEMFGDPITNEKGWEVKTMKEVCNEIGDGLHGTPQYDPNGNIAFINGNNLIDGKITITDRTQYVNETEAKKIFIKMDLNTVLLSINGTLGKTAIYNNENVVLGKSACYLRLSNLLTALFVMALMNTHTFKDFLESNSSKSTIKNVGLKSIRNYKVILPPLAMQQQFASKIEAVERQKKLINQSIKEVKTLINSRIDYYFN